MTLPTLIGLQTIDNSTEVRSAHNIAAGAAGTLDYRIYDEAAQAGATLARIPLSMAYIDNLGLANGISWQDHALNYVNTRILPKLIEATANGMKVILQPAQTPQDLLPLAW